MHSSALLLSLCLAIPTLARMGKGGGVGGNRVNNKYRLVGDKFGDGNTLNMQSQSQQEGGGVVRGRAVGENYWDLEARDADPSSTIRFSGTRFGVNNHINVRDAELEDLLDLDTRDAHNDLDLYVDSLHRRDAKGGGKAFSGGDGAGGSGDGSSGNKAVNVQNFKKSNYGKGVVINSGNQVMQQGGNAKGGRGGMNKGDGGAGGGFDLNIPIPPMRRRDPYDYEDMLYARDAYAYAEAEPLPEPKKAGGRAFSGGDAKGGSADGQSGNNAVNVQKFQKSNFGDGSVINSGNQVSQKGGNAWGGFGGANFGNGGKGGDMKLSAGMRRRAIEYVLAREAEPEPQAEAEPEAEAEADADADAEAYAEAEPEAEADADEFDLYERKAIEDPDAELYARDEDWFENFA